MPLSENKAANPLFVAIRVHSRFKRVSADCECIEQGSQRFRGSAALPDDEKIPGGFGIRKWDHRDTGHGKTLEVGRDQGDGAFASDQSKHVRNTGCFLHEFWPEPSSTTELSDPAVAS